MRYAAKWPVYAEEWNSMTIKPDREIQFTGLAKRLLVHKQRYESIENLTGVPWYLIAVLHLRESDANFDTYLGNGESIHHVTKLVPRGRGPFATFEDGAVDALNVDGLTSVHDWRLEKVLYYCEIFNGAGYDSRGLPSPYVWGGTNVQKPGKYVGDRRFNAKIWDMQPGCAPILKTLAELDQTIQFTRES